MPTPAHEKVLANGTADQHGELELGASVWFYKKTGGKIYVLAQKRAHTVHNGGYYDVSAGGHVDKGETPLEGALRETREEIGVELHPSDVEFLCAYRATGKIVYVYLSDRTSRDDVFTLDYAEVESVEWVALDDFPEFAETRLKPNLRNDHFHLELLEATLGHR